MRTTLGLVGLTAGLALGCGSEGVGPPPDGDGALLATQFERLADSVDAGGYSPAGDALRHAAEIVRLTGHATAVNVAIDDRPRSFLAVAEQIDFPNLVCSWPADSGRTEPGDTVSVPPGDSTTMLPPRDSSTPPDSGLVPPRPEEPPEPPECTVQGTFSMRTLIAWEPQHMDEVVRIVADLGSNRTGGVPDVMTSLPSKTATAAPSLPPSAASPDSGSGSGGSPGGFPGFLGEYLVRNVGSWWAVEGSQANNLASSGGACTEERARFDWAEFSCESAQFQFAFRMSVEPLRYQPLTGAAGSAGGPEGSHTVSLESSNVDGVRLTWESWNPPPAPPPGPPPGPDPVPVDSTGVARPM
jgi:hypothetical protein